MTTSACVGMGTPSRAKSFSRPFCQAVSQAPLTTSYKLPDAVKTSVRSRVRPVLMTAAMAAIGLMPAALSHGIGSESQRPLAIVIIGGLIGATFFALFVFPLIVEIVYGKMLYDKDGRLKQKKR